MSIALLFCDIMPCSLRTAPVLRSFPTTATQFTTNEPQSYVLGDRNHPSHISSQYDIYDTRQGTATKCAARNQRAQKVSAEKVEGINTNKEIININNNLSINQNQGDNTYQEEFGRLWAEYPCQEGMVPAFNAYIEARETGTSYDEIEEGLQLFVQQIKDNHIKHCYAMSGQKWFEGKHWTDDMPSTKSKNNKALW